MVISIDSLVPNADDLLSLDVDELAGVLLTHLNSRRNVIQSSGTTREAVFPIGFFVQLNRELHVYGDKQWEVAHALMEAWAWLVREAFLVERHLGSSPSSNQSEFFISRRGKLLTSREEFGAYRKASSLPKGQLHPLIAGKVYPAFLRGEYDTAIFQAFREVEVSVRNAGNFQPEFVGEKLMRAAFASGKNGQPGPLADTGLPSGEQEAMAHLFAGAFGLYRNSTAHRYVPTKAEEAAEVIMFASQLLRIVDRRKPLESGSEGSAAVAGG